MRHSMIIALFCFAIPTFALAVEGPISQGHLRLGAGGERDLERQTIAQILEIQEDSTVVVRDLYDRETRLLTIHDGIRLRAQSRQEFDGRKKLSLKDLEPGRILRITLTYPFGKVRKVRVLRQGNVPKKHFQTANELGKNPELFLEHFLDQGDS